MKILFVGDENQKWGSTRLHIYNLASWLKELGHNVYINNLNNTSYDVIVLGKEVKLERLKQIKNTYKSSLIAKVNPSDANKEEIECIKLSDFLIVGCIPERDYYLKYKSTILIVPQIENIFTKKKKHVPSDKITIGYHGNLHHLEQLNPNIKPALERLALKYPIKLLAIYDINSLGKWEIGRPNIDIHDVQWDLKTIEEELLKCDIGIVPGLYPIMPGIKKFIFKIIDLLTQTHDGLESDYLTRYKNTTNSGREFVFHQLGIPVVSDFIPTGFHILGTPENGYLAYSEEGWYQALYELCESFELRQSIADNATREFERLYNPINWVKSEFGKIEKLLVK